jgi:hypothetical protein
MLRSLRGAHLNTLWGLAVHVVSEKLHDRH